MSLRILSKKEIKIFLTFFIIYAYFISWPGMNENSRFFLTRAIVDEGKFEIDSYYNQTGDRSFFNEYYYSDKEPGLSFLAVPVYATWKFVYQFFPGDFREKNSGSGQYIIEKTHGVPVYTLINPGFFILTSMILVTIFTSSFFSALTVVLIYKISGYFLKEKKYRILIAIVYGLGSLVFHYSLVFLSHATGAFFIFFSFFLLFKAKKDRITSKKYFILAGLFSGFAAVVEMPTLLISFLLFLYVLSFRRKENIFMFLLGGFIGILPLLLYNYAIFNNPFDLPRRYLDPTIWLHLQDNVGLIINPIYNLHIMIRLLIYPYRGLFIYFPILVLSIVGLFYMRKKYKIEMLLISSIFLVILFLTSAWWAWWHGASFGPRHFMIAVPFLMIPIMFCFKRIDLGLIILFLMISIFVNFSGLQTSYEDMLKDPKNSMLLSEYQEKLDKFQILANPLKDYYFKEFLKFGPRSRMFEGLVFREKKSIDIRTIKPLPASNVPLLSTIPLLLIISLIWRKSISSIFQRVKIRIF